MKSDSELGQGDLVALVEDQHLARPPYESLVGTHQPGETVSDSRFGPGGLGWQRHS